MDYVKVDWCGDVKHMPLDGIMVGAKDYRNFSHALTHTPSKRPMYFEGVAAYIFLLSDVPQYVNAWRASTDHHDEWSNLMEVVDTVALVGLPGRPGAWSYMDVIMTGGEGCRGQAVHQALHCPGMTDEEYKSEYSLWWINQSPLVVATDVRNMTAVMTKLLLNQPMLAIHQDTRTGPGKHTGGDGRCGALLGALQCQYWVRVLADGSVAVVLFNSDGASHAMSFPFGGEQAKHLPAGWGGNTTVAATEMWGLVPKFTATGHVRATVAAHGVAVFHLVRTA